MGCIDAMTPSSARRDRSAGWGSWTCSMRKRTPARPAAPRGRGEAGGAPQVGRVEQLDVLDAEAHTRAARRLAVPREGVEYLAVGPVADGVNHRPQPRRHRPTDEGP